MVKVEGRLHNIKEIRHNAYKSNAINREAYEYVTDRGIYLHEIHLPRFNGKTFYGWLKEKFEQNGEPVAILDIGCGRGNMLGELLNPEYGHPPIRAYGISSYNYFERLPQIEKDFIDPDGEIDYRVGDAHRLLKIFPDIKFDIVVSHQTFMHLGDPLSVLKQAYTLCKEGGVMFIDLFGQPLTPSQVDLLRAFWKKDGIVAEFHIIPDAEKLKGHSAWYSVSMQKGENPRLILPFHYNGERYLAAPSNKAVVYTRINYEFDRKRVENVVRGRR